MIVTTYSVHCDAELCGETMILPPGTADARQAAYDRGWRSFDAGRFLCPTCIDRTTGAGPARPTPEEFEAAVADVLVESPSFTRAEAEKVVRREGR